MSAPLADASSSPVSSRELLLTDEALRRFRRLAATRRALVIVEGICALLFLLFFGLEITLPDVLARLVGSVPVALALLLSLPIAVVLLQIGAAALEWVMGATLEVPQTPVRRVFGVLYLVPGVMVLRRLIQSLVAAGLLALLCVTLLLYVLMMILFALPLRVSDALSRPLGIVVDGVDQAVSWLWSSLRRAFQAVVQAPAFRVEDADDLLLPLLQRQRQRRARSP